MGRYPAMVDFVIPKRLLNGHSSKIGGGRALPSI
jgi:hypothetical protein